MTDENIQSFKELLLQLSWVEVINEQNCSKAYDEFLNTFFFYYNSYFPLIERNFNINYHKKEQWQTLGLLTSRRNKNRLQKLFYDKRTPQAQIQYRNYRNIYNKLVREAKKAYYEELIENNSGNPKKMWGILNGLMGKKTKSSSINEIITDNGCAQKKVK